MARRVFIHAFDPASQLAQLIRVLETTDGPLNIIFTESYYCVDMFNYLDRTKSEKHAKLWDTVVALTKNRNICLKWDPMK